MANVDNVTEHQSKIVSLQVENFMSVKEATVDFTNNNVVSLCGYNDSGKSAITRLFEVMFFNSYLTDQVKFITDGEEYWKGVMTFSDGVVYTRAKYSNGRSLWELSKDGKILFTNKLPNGTFAAIENIPDVIANYLGVIKDEATGQKVNVRRNSDDLFLIETSGGENYKMLNTILRSEVLAQASMALNTDKNKLAKQLDEDNTKRTVLTEEYEEIEVAPTHYLNRLEKFIHSLDTNNKKLSSITDIVEGYQIITSTQIYDELKTVDISRLIELQEIAEHLKCSQGSIYDKLECVDLSRLNALRNIMTLLGETHIDCYDALIPIDITKLKSIYELCNLYNNYASIEKSISEDTVKLENTKKQLKELSEKYDLKVCQNCGSIVA